MPVQEFSEADINRLVEAMAPRLTFLLEERRVPRAVIAAIGHDDIVTVAQFAKTGRNEEGFYRWVEDDLGIKTTDQGGRSLQARLADAWEAAQRHKEEAETMAGRARAMGLKPETMKGDQIELRKKYRQVAGTIENDEYPSYSYIDSRLEELEEGELIAEPLDAVTTRQMELNQSSDSVRGITWNKRGDPVLKKHQVRGHLPRSTEEYRLLYRVMKHHWGIIRLRHGSRPFLLGLDFDFWANHVEHMLGREVYGYVIKDAQENILARLSWHDFLTFDQEVRKKAIQMVNEDGDTLAGAMTSARKDNELRTQIIVQSIAVAHLVSPPPMQLSQSGGRGLKRNNPPPLALEDDMHGDHRTSGSAGSQDGNKGSKGKGNKKKQNRGGKGKGTGKKADDPHWARLLAAKRLTKRSQTQPDGKGDCWDYNLPKGCTNPNCQFHHLCIFCGRSHPLPTCAEFSAVYKSSG